MSEMSALLSDAINSIIDTKEESDVDSLFKSGGGIRPAFESERHQRLRASDLPRGNVKGGAYARIAEIYGV